MAAPQNDLFANAIALATASGSTLGTNVEAAAESGEPANHGKTVWWKWKCPVTDNYFFRTHGSNFTRATDFKSKIQVFTANTPLAPVVNNLTEVAVLYDQRLGNGNGFEYGATVAFAATLNTFYWVRVDTRDGSDGLISLNWDSYKTPILGNCTSCATFDASIEDACWKIVYKVNDDSRMPFSYFVGETHVFGLTNATLGKASFGFFSRMPGMMTIKYCGGQLLMLVGTFNTITRTGIQNFSADLPGGLWSKQHLDELNFALSTGQLADQDENNPVVSQSYNWSTTLIEAALGVPTVTFADGASTIGSLGSDACASFSFVNKGGEIFAKSQDTGNAQNGSAGFSEVGIGKKVVYGANIPDAEKPFALAAATNFNDFQIFPTFVKPTPVGPSRYVPESDSPPFAIESRIAPLKLYYPQLSAIQKWNNSSSPPLFKLIYTSLASCISQGSCSVSNSGTAYTGTFSIINQTSIAWTNVVVTLANSGGVTGASAAQTISLAANATTGVTFTFTASEPFVAEILISFNAAPAVDWKWLVSPLIVATLAGTSSSPACSGGAQDNFQLTVSNAGYGKTSNLVMTVLQISPTGSALMLTCSVPCGSVTPAQASVNIGTVAPLSSVTQRFAVGALNGSTPVALQIQFADDFATYPPLNLSAVI